MYKEVTKMMDKNILQKTRLWDRKTNTFWMWANYPDPKTGVPIPRFVQVPERYFEVNVYPYLEAYRLYHKTA